MIHSSLAAVAASQQRKKAARSSPAYKDNVIFYSLHQSEYSSLYSDLCVREKKITVMQFAAGTMNGGYQPVLYPLMK